jgi:hypothetical protein
MASAEVSWWHTMSWMFWQILWSATNWLWSKCTRTKVTRISSSMRISWYESWMTMQLTMGTVLVTRHLMSACNVTTINLLLVTFW